jgi:hypothetical protein
MMYLRCVADIILTFKAQTSYAMTIPTKMPPHNSY